MDFPELFSPTEIRGIPFKNRLFFGPHGTGMSEGGLLGARQIAYYEARIRNNIGRTEPRSRSRAVRSLERVCVRES